MSYSPYATVVENGFTRPTRLVHSSEPLKERFYQKKVLYLPKNNQFPKQDIFHKQPERTNCFYPKKKFLYLPKKITIFPSEKFFYDFLRKQNFLNEKIFILLPEKNNFPNKGFLILMWKTNFLYFSEKVKALHLRYCKF